MKKLIAAGTIALMTSGLAMADDHNKHGLFVEPALTYEKGEGELQGSGNPTADIEGLGIGLRLGYHAWESLFIGVDGRYSVPKFDSGDLNFNESAQAYNWGPVIGYQMPTDIGLRIWGSWIAGAELETNESNQTSFLFEDGTGYRVGAGIKLGIASVNLEYQMLTYGDGTAEVLNANAPITDDFDQKSWLLSLSFPISI